MDLTYQSGFSLLADSGLGHVPAFQPNDAAVMLIKPGASGLQQYSKLLLAQKN
jgi:hypothetical protein